MKFYILVSLAATAIAFPSQVIPFDSMEKKTINSASSEESLATQYDRYNPDNYQNGLSNGQLFPSNAFSAQYGEFLGNQGQGSQFGNQQGYGYPRGFQQNGGRRFGQQQNGNRRGWGQLQNGGNPQFGNQNGNNQQLGPQQQNGGYPQFGNQQNQQSAYPFSQFGQNGGGFFNPREGQALEGGLFQGLQNRGYPIEQGAVSGSFPGNDGQPQQNQEFNQFPFGGQLQQSGFASSNKV
ncbi:unnamed protein product [Cylicostephanus goldi]|uniref:Uncharacterized protein n=1 Tax=Cylicostephanus goldi TaxID=71465 RepID=A0A3P7M0B6_CYLGO|nr:unnamed protein product [Cylicostephanus goldi]